MRVYRKIPLIITITNAILEPLTTRIWVIPALVNCFFVSLERSSILPIVIQRIIPDIFSGNHRKILHFAQFCIDCNRFSSVFVILLNVGTMLFP